MWSESCSVVSYSLGLHGLYSPWNSLGKNTDAGSLSLLQGIFPTQGSNPGLLHYRRILYSLSQQGSLCVFYIYSNLKCGGTYKNRRQTPCFSGINHILEDMRCTSWNNVWIAFLISASPSSPTHFSQLIEYTTVQLHIWENTYTCTQTHIWVGIHHPDTHRYSCACTHTRTHRDIPATSA